MVDPDLAQHVCVGRGITDNSEYLVNTYVEKWKPYPIRSNDEIHNNGHLVGGFIIIADSMVRVTFGVNPRDNGFIVRRVADLHPTDVVLQKFGFFEDDSAFFQDDTFVSWLRNYLVKSDMWADQNWLLRLRALQPIRSKIAHGKISLYQTRKDADNDRHVAMKAGRALKYIFPELNDSDIEVLGDAFREKFSLRTFKLKTGTSPDDFTHAYSHNQADMDNPRTTCARKAMIHSCMRYEFERLEVHPCSIYGSGDFKIAWLETDSGLIAGRVVVYTAHKSRPQAGPIYGVCENSLNQLQDWLDSINAVGYDSGSRWLGAKVLAVPYDDNGAYIGPYLDVTPQRMTTSDDGEYLIIDDCGEVDASTYQGILNGSYTNCSECGESLNEDDYYYSEYTDEHYCECCYSNEHTYCEVTGDMVHNSELVQVWSSSRWGIQSEMVSECDRDSNYIECIDGKHWHDDDATWCESEEVWCSPNDMGDNYFQSDWDGEVYNKGVMCTTEDGEVVAEDEIINSNDTWEKTPEGVWIKVEEEEECIA
tara:strand:+ start:247 stop:1851 length:1605 start_codon:yes stop_codon:yes gene_type:complete